MALSSENKYMKTSEKAVLVGISSAWNHLPCHHIWNAELYNQWKWPDTSRTAARNNICHYDWWNYINVASLGPDSEVRAWYAEDDCNIRKTS